MGAEEGKADTISSIGEPGDSSHNSPETSPALAPPSSLV